MNKNPEIQLHNGFSNHGGEGDLLVGIITKGSIAEDAVLIIEDRKIEMSKIQIHEDLDWNVTRIEFEVERNLESPVYWWKLYNSKLGVRNTIDYKTI